MNNSWFVLQEYYIFVSTHCLTLQSYKITHDDWLSFYYYFIFVHVYGIYSVVLTYLDIAKLMLGRYLALP